MNVMFGLLSDFSFINRVTTLKLPYNGVLLYKLLAEIVSNTLENDDFDEVMKMKAMYDDPATNSIYSRTLSASFQ